MPIISFAAETLSNTGFVPSNVWYSKDPFYAGDKIRIYSVVFSGSDKDLRGRVNFYDNNSLICTSEFFSLASRISEVWCDWSVTVGKHIFSIKITNPKASEPGEPEESVVLSNSELKVGERIVSPPPAQKSPSTVEQKSLPTDDKKFGTTTLGIVEKIKDLFFTTGDKAEYKEAKDNMGEPPVDSGSYSASTKNKILTTKGGATFDKTVPAGLDTDSRGEARTPLSFLAGIYPALIKARDIFYSLTDSLADWILPKLKALSVTENRPLAAVLTFIYKIAEFVFVSPLLFGSIIVLAFWKILRVIFGGREEF